MLQILWALTLEVATQMVCGRRAPSNRMAVLRGVVDCALGRSWRPHPMV